MAHLWAHEGKAHLLISVLLVTMPTAVAHFVFPVPKGNVYEQHLYYCAANVDDTCMSYRGSHMQGVGKLQV